MSIIGKKRVSSELRPQMLPMSTQSNHSKTKHPITKWLMGWRINDRLGRKSCQGENYFPSKPGSHHATFYAVFVAGLNSRRATSVSRSERIARTSCEFRRNYRVLVGVSLRIVFANSRKRAQTMRILIGEQFWRATEHCRISGVPIWSAIYGRRKLRRSKNSTGRYPQTRRILIGVLDGRLSRKEKLHNLTKCDWKMLFFIHLIKT